MLSRSPIAPRCGGADRPETQEAPGTQKAPTPEGEGLSLPELDSNQQPAG